MNTLLAVAEKAVLFLSGALLCGVALLILVAPAGFYAGSDIDAGASVSLLNELKAPAGLLLAAGVLVLAAVFVRALAGPAAALAAMIYLSYAASRVVSMWLDGRPADALVQAAVLEAVVGLACLTLVLRARRPGRQAA